MPSNRAINQASKGQKVRTPKKPKPSKKPVKSKANQKKVESKFEWNIGKFRKLKAKLNGEHLQTVNININGVVKANEANKWTSTTLKTLIKNKPGYSFQVQYSSNGMWAHTKWLDNASEFLTPDLEHYELDINDFPVNMIKINVKKNAKLNGKGVGDKDPYNNCLYNALRWALTYEVAEMMPTFPNEAWELKKMLKIEKCDGVHVKHIPTLEEKLKININVFGDHIYTSPHLHQRTVSVKLQDGHFEYKANSKMSASLRTYNKVRELVYYNIVDDIVVTYD